MGSSLQIAISVGGAAEVMPVSHRSGAHRVRRLDQPPSPSARRCSRTIGAHSSAAWIAPISRAIAPTRRRRTRRRCELRSIFRLFGARRRTVTPSSKRRNGSGERYRLVERPNCSPTALSRSQQEGSSAFASRAIGPPASPVSATIRGRPRLPTPARRRLETVGEEAPDTARLSAWR